MRFRRSTLRRRCSGVSLWWLQGVLHLQQSKGRLRGLQQPAQQPHFKRSSRCSRFGRWGGVRRLREGLAFSRPLSKYAAFQHFTAHEQGHLESCMVRQERISAQLVKCMIARVHMHRASFCRSTYQIIGTISWNLGVRFPEPFSTMLAFLSALQFDFTFLECIFENTDYITRVYLTSLLPIAVAFFIGVLYMMRRYRCENESEGRIRELNFQHSWALLLLSYLVLPTCSMIQFQGLDCQELAHGPSFLVADSNIDCASASYRSFAVVDALFIFVYQSIPLFWLFFLWRSRDKLNPPGQPQETTLKNRESDESLQHLNFLFSDYTPKRWSEFSYFRDLLVHVYLVLRPFTSDAVPSRYYEVVDMYRRMMFIAVLPLLGTGVLRAVLGCLLSVFAALAVFVESPFLLESTNTLLITSQVNHCAISCLDFEPLLSLVCVSACHQHRSSIKLCQRSSLPRSS